MHQVKLDFGGVTVTHLGDDGARPSTFNFDTQIGFGTQDQVPEEVSPGDNRVVFENSEGWLVDDYEFTTTIDETGERLGGLRLDLPLEEQFPAVLGLATQRNLLDEITFVSVTNNARLEWTLSGVGVSKLETSIGVNEVTE